MALPNTVWYTRDNTGVGWTAVTAWATGVSKSPGSLIRQATAPTVGNERVFVAIQTAAGNTGATEPTWVVTKGAKTTDNAVTWQECTGQAGINGDLTNCPSWTNAKSNAIALGYIIKNTAGTFLFICTTAGTAGSGSEPTWNTTAGQTTTDNTVTWTSIGAVGNFGTWAAPFSRVGNAIASTWATAGDSVYVASEHSEVSASVAQTWNAGAAGNPILIACVPTSPIPPVSTTTGAVVSVGTTTGASPLNIGTSANTQLYIVGLTLSTGSAGTGNGMVFGASVANVIVVFEKCTLRLVSSGTLQVGSVNSAKPHLYRFDGCTITMGSATGNIQMFYGQIEFVNCTMWGSGTIPTTPFTMRTNVYRVLLRASDLGGLSSSTALFTSQQNGVGPVIFRNCRLNPTIPAAVAGFYAGYAVPRIKLQNCDNSATNYRLNNTQFSGILQASTTTYRATGANDNTTAISWQIVNNSSATFLVPFETDDLIVWNGLTGSTRTASIYLTTATTLTNADAWIELEYLGDSGSSLGTSDLSSKQAWFASAVALTTDSSSTWTSGLGNNYVISVSFTPQVAGPVRARFYLAKPSVTVNLDPELVIT